MTTTSTPSLRVVRVLGWAFAIATVLLVVGILSNEEWLTFVGTLIRGLLGLPA